MHKPTDSVRIVIYDKANPNQFIILSETDDPDNLKLPGGKFEGNETPDEAAARELAEELGVSPQDVNLTRAGELINDDGESKRYIYAGQCDSRLLKPSNEIDHTELCTKETIPEGKNQGHILSAVSLAKTA
jgi:8-oxo-dGTP pyrophosphatase MutT (NUDIX family)